MDKKDITYLSSDTSIKKSNVISKAKLFHGLTLNQMQLFAYAIYVTQHNGESSFHKSDFEKQFDMSQYHTQQAYKDARTLIGLSVELPTEKEDDFKFRSIFAGIDYENGRFTFEWTKYIKPHILALKNRYIQTDLKVTVNFKSSFSWTLYDYLKASYGRLYLKFTKEELMNIFSVEKVKSYKKNTSLFKRNVLDIAVDEVNKYTEYTCKYEEIKKGRAIIGFKIFFTKGEVEQLATPKQINYLKNLLKGAQFEFMFQISEIKNNEQRGLANYLLEEIVNLFLDIENEKEFIYSFIDEKIKKTNERISLLNKIINEDKLEQSDPFANLNIPIDYWDKRLGGKD